MKTICIAGKLGRDAETRDVGKDTVTSFSVAVDERGKGGEKSTVWFDCSIWGRRGTALEQYLTKGSAVTVSGEFSARKYQARDGSEKTAFGVRVDQITLQGGNRNGGGQRQERQGSGASDYDDGGDDWGADAPF